jgi:hypothetical protein
MLPRISAMQKTRFPRITKNWKTLIANGPVLRGAYSNTQPFEERSCNYTLALRRIFWNRFCHESIQHVGQKTTDNNKR